MSRLAARLTSAPTWRGRGTTWTARSCAVPASPSPAGASGRSPHSPNPQSPRTSLPGRRPALHNHHRPSRFTGSLSPKYQPLFDSHPTHSPKYQPLTDPHPAHSPKYQPLSDPHLALSPKYQSLSEPHLALSPKYQPLFDPHPTHSPKYQSLSDPKNTSPSPTPTRYSPQNTSPRPTPRPQCLPGPNPSLPNTNLSWIPIPHSLRNTSLTPSIHFPQNTTSRWSTPSPHCPPGTLPCVNPSPLSLSSIPAPGRPPAPAPGPHGPGRPCPGLSHLQRAVVGALPRERRRLRRELGRGRPARRIPCRPPGSRPRAPWGPTRRGPGWRVWRPPAERTAGPATSGVLPTPVPGQKEAPVLQ
ncbi:hypothetical protein ANANG_G00195180 [Anguilla anguilla]|uniref:Uncharacterized protein n=1 Tax=Anguilla anguilla TaxID=7936 RepID=A0A9D3M1S2_ANGAN|nr:hypothetical protein ANANG_G00195180 [Anguilla anguilla]